MRNPLKRHAQPDRPKVPLRERLAKAKDKLRGRKADTEPSGKLPVDFELTVALDDLARIDAAQNAFLDREPWVEGSEPDQHAAYRALEAERDDALGRLTIERAVSMTGLQAKASGLLSRSVSGCSGPVFAGLASSLARDVLGLATNVEPACAADTIRVSPAEPAHHPVLAAIEAHRSAYAEWDRADNEASRYLSNDARYVAMQPSLAASEQREQATWADLFQVRPTTIEGLRALIDYLPLATRQVSIDMEDSAEQRALDVLRTAAAGLFEALPATVDPIHAAIEASRAAEAAVVAFDERTGGTGLTRADFDEEQRLTGVKREARDAAFATAPTTLQGARALVDYASFQLGLFGFKDWEHPANDEHIFGEALRALANAILALGGAEPSRGALDKSGLPGLPGMADIPDLSGCDLAQLARLYEALGRAGEHVGAESQLPCFWRDDRMDMKPAGKILEAEEDRIGWLLHAIWKEAGRRVPSNDDERNERLTLLIRQEIAATGRIEDGKLLAEVAKAWGV